MADEAANPIDVSTLTYATVGDFALHLGVCAKTVRRWIDAGMPAMRNRRVVRVVVRDATAWLHAGGASRPRVQRRQPRP